MSAVDLDALVASPHWEWRPGMLVRWNGGGQTRIESVGRLAFDGTGGAPDIDDDATCGCLLALVRKAWGDGFNRVEITVYEDGSACVDIVSASNADDDHDFPEDTLGQALAAALLAAPKAEAS